MKQLCLEKDVFGHERNPAALRHGVTGIQNEVQKYLVQVAGSALNSAEPGAVDEDQIDVAAQNASEHPLQVLNKRPKVKGNSIDGGWVAKAQNLAGQWGGLTGGLADLKQIISQRMLGGQAVQGHLVIPHDNHQQTVKVMRHSGGHSA